MQINVPYVNSAGDLASHAISSKTALRLQLLGFLEIYKQITAKASASMNPASYLRCKCVSKIERMPFKYPQLKRELYAHKLMYSLRLTELD